MLAVGTGQPTNSIILGCVGVFAVGAALDCLSLFSLVCHYCPLSLGDGSI